MGSYFMLPQTEDKRQMGEHALPLNIAKQTGKRPRKHWLALLIALIVLSALLISGIWSRVKARAALNTETAQAALTVDCNKGSQSARLVRRPIS